MALWLASTATAVAATPPDPATLLAALRQVPPSRVDFHERRASPLLVEALHFSGELERPAAGALLKRIDTPFREQVRIEGERVLVEREGKPPRRFSLRRAPELGALTASFEAVLGGDLALLQQHFTLRMEGASPSWVMHLDPRDPRLAKKVEALRFLGSGTELRCMDLVLAGAETSRTWLGPQAAAASQAVDETSRDALCHMAE
jgi:hypothetical protein